jgi:D-alanyl-D-alanine carboxypeptidase/D-alanyl-D-alanine-endopeptidase (penicillin-binding protein 4)
MPGPDDDHPRHFSKGPPRARQPQYPPPGPPRPGGQQPPRRSQSQPPRQPRRREPQPRPQPEWTSGGWSVDDRFPHTRVETGDGRGRDRRPGNGGSGDGWRSSEGRADHDDGPVPRGSSGGFGPPRPPDDDYDSDDGDRGREPGRFRWVLPVLLGLGAVVAAVGAVVLNGDDPAQAVGVTDQTTPVLSARRAPELIAAPVADRRLAADLDAWVAQSSPTSCLVVQSGDSAAYDHNGDTPLVGASTQKLVTATALLLAFGADGTLKTTAGSTVPPAAGVVAGDLYIVGGGDPMLTTGGYASTFDHELILSNDPAQLADAIAAAGITRIEGSVIGDDTRYDADRFSDHWPGRYASQGVVGSISALNIDDSNNTLGLSPAPADPPTNAAAILTDLLRQRGVTIGGEGHSGTAPEGLTAVAELPSRPVHEIVKEMLTESDNETAEMSFKEIGLQNGGAGTWAAGATAVTQLLTDGGLPMEGIQIVDGSGLSSDDRLTCQFVVDLLTRPETGPTLVEGLAVAGETGTLHDRFEGTAAAGHLRAKTGTLNEVTALSGMVQPTQGGALTFSYVTNAPAGTTIGPADVARQNGLADILMGYPRGVDLTALVPAAAPAAVPADG